MPSTVNRETNVHRNMLLKQHLFNQEFSLENSLQSNLHQQGRKSYYQQQHDQVHCPQFTAPNLSQYHFVSSQEVRMANFFDPVFCNIVFIFLSFNHKKVRIHSVKELNYAKYLYFGRGKMM